MSKNNDFFDKVYAIVQQIPFGRATSYGAIAKHLGAARSSRMVGYAMNAAHTLPDVPAHRVVNRNGVLTGKHHFPGTNLMQQLLESENIKVVEDQIVDFKTVFWDPKIELREKLNVETKRVDSTDSDFIALVKKLDEDLAVRDGKDLAFYAQYNGIDSLRNVIVASLNNSAVGCGAIKTLNDETAEVKRMYTDEDHRGKGIASIVLKELEVWAKTLGFKKCVLETGKMQLEAIALYKKQGYKIIKNYRPYKMVEDSICLQKLL